MTAPLLEISGLRKSFIEARGLFRQRHETVAVDDVSFSVAPGAVHGLAGESGSGKSTIARMILGLERADAGTIRIAGETLGAGMPARARGKLVQMVFQNPGGSLNPRRSVAQSIAVPLVAAGMAGPDRARRIAELLDRVHLPANFTERYPHELSGGQKQRVAIARALAVTPRLLVLDEPTSALDVSVQARIIDLLRELGRELGLTYLFISHDLSLMRNFADRVGILYRGQIVETGPVAKVFTSPAHDYTRLLLASVPVISDEEAALRPVIELIDGEMPSAEQLMEIGRLGQGR